MRESVSSVQRSGSSYTVSRSGVTSWRTARRSLDVDRQAVLRYAEAVEEIALQYFARMQRALRHDYARSPILTRTVNTWLCIARPPRPNAVRISGAAQRPSE